MTLKVALKVEKGNGILTRTVSKFKRLYCFLVSTPFFRARGETLAKVAANVAPPANANFSFHYHSQQVADKTIKNLSKTFI